MAYHAHDRIAKNSGLLLKAIYESDLREAYR